MDIEQALDILNLAPDACLEDARISFRKLAKKHHPDRFNLNNVKITENEKMKDINVAFHLLSKNLKPKKKPESEIEPKHIIPKQNKTKKSTFFQNFSILFKKINKNFKKSTQVKTQHKKEKPSKKFKPANKSGKNANRKYTFDSLLKKTIKRSFTRDPVEPDTTDYILKPKNKKTYATYMELKQKMCSKRKFTKVEGSTPIEKISPISPINKI